MEEVIVNKKAKIPILLSILVFLILTSGTYYYWYMPKLLEVNDIKLIVKQSEKLDLQRIFP